MACAVGMLLNAGCAGGSPLMHPAHTMKQGDVRFAAGVSANIVAGNAGDAIATDEPSVQRRAGG